MTNTEPKAFPCLYTNDKYFGKSLDEVIGLQSAEGHVLRDSKSGKFLYFENHIQLSNWFYKQEKPYIHSVINKYRPVPFNIELDMETAKLDNFHIDQKHADKIMSMSGWDINKVKYHVIVEQVKDAVYDILEEYFGVEVSDYKFLEATDNRNDKYSHRLYMGLSFENLRGYKHFCKLLKNTVRADISQFIDPTSLMLRTPGSYKDDHVCKWITPGCKIEDSLLDYTKNCGIIRPIEGLPEEKDNSEWESFSDETKNKAMEVLKNHKIVAGNFEYDYKNNTESNILSFKRVQPSYCEICQRTHDNIDGYATFHRDHVTWRCFQDDSKSGIYINYVGEQIQPLKYRLSDIKELLKNNEKLFKLNPLEVMTPEHIKKFGEHIISNGFTDHSIAEFFLCRPSWKNKLIHFDGNIYHFDKYWILSDETILYNELATNVYTELKKVIDDKYNSPEQLKQYMDVLKMLSKLQSWSGRTGIVNSIKSICGYHATRGNPFDKNNDLLGFVNGVMDLKLSEFRDQRPGDMISKVVPYPYTQASEQEMKEVNGVINKIMPLEEERKCLLTTMATSLDGRVLDKILIFTGAGRNGKDTLCTNMLRTALGDDLYYFQNSAVITEKMKTGPNQAVADMRGKRAVVISEPPKDQTMKAATLKMITGSSAINARGLNSKDTKTTLNQTLIILANDIPPLDVIDDAIYSRLEVFQFNSLFKDPDEIKTYPADTPHLYLKNKKYISQEWLNKHRVAFINILLQHYVFYRDGGFVINIPPSIEQNKKNYISETSELSNWFFSEYEIVDDEKSFIKMKDVYQSFRQSDMFENMTKKDKRIFNKTKLTQQISRHPSVRGFYRDRVKIGGTNLRSVLIKIKRRPIDLDDL
jgi:hypothetical protein